MLASGEEDIIDFNLAFSFLIANFTSSGYILLNCLSSKIFSILSSSTLSSPNKFLVTFNLSLNKNSLFCLSKDFFNSVSIS